MSDGCKFCGGVIFAVSTTDSKPPSLIPPAVPAARTSEKYRTNSIGTRLSEAELSEVEAAAASAGKKVGEWLRDAALAQARSSLVTPPIRPDPILLAELMAIRTLILNLFAAASKGPLTDESLRKMLAYADSVKQQKADEFLVKLRAKNGGKPSEEVP